MTGFPRAFLLVSVANLFFFLNYASFFLLPLFLGQLGATEASIGRIMGTQALAGLCSLPVLALVIDRVGRRGLLLAGSIGMTVLSWCYAHLDGLGPTLFLLRILQGVSFTAAFTAASALAIDLAPRARLGQAIGLFGISTLTTHAIGPALGEQVVALAGFPVLFRIAALYGAVGTFLVLWIPRPVGAPAPVGERVADSQGFWAPGLAMAAVTWCAGMGFGSVLTFTPTLARSLGIPRVGPFFLSYTAAAVAVRVFGGSLSDRYGRFGVLGPSLAAFAVAVGSLGLVRDLTGLCAAGVLFGGAQGFVYPTANALMAELAGPGRLGRAQTLFQGAFGSGVAASAFFFGSLVERAGYGAMFAASAGTVAVGLAWLLLVRRLVRRQA